jgi:broad specificity phosphatase PhoE
MGKVYLLRHGETEYHAQGRLLGRLDIGLNERGREMARRVAAYFEGVELAAIYSSPLKRCRETVQPLAEAKGLEVVVEEGLMELDMGEWDGQLVKDLFERDGERVGKWMANPTEVTIPGGEDFDSVRDRVISAARRITALHPGDERILVVAHGGPIRGIICETLNMDFNNMFRLQVDLASVSAIKYFERGIPDTAVVTLVNETTHLRQGRS